MAQKSPLNIHTFHRPVAVLRCLKQEKEWLKAAYRALPSHLPVWEKEVVLKNGCVRDGQLVLHANGLLNMPGHSAAVLLLKGTNEVEWLQVNHGSHATDHFLQLYSKDGGLWLECNDFYYNSTGAKGRGRFDLGPLLPGKSVAVHINARWWHSLSGRRDTHYVENYLYFEHLGVFDEALVVKDLGELFTFEPQKEIDLRQMMY
ncbi:MAG: hypothetical protein IT270_13835 [Saprospiraceae bacterium]|nr:hypothetical protein [Saprospiraceae bacterium]